MSHQPFAEPVSGMTLQIRSVVSFTFMGFST